MTPASRMSRRDRVSLMLALEVTRSRVYATWPERFDTLLEVLWAGDRVAQEVRGCLRMEGDRYTYDRALLARLALLLRCLLRADAGDVYSIECISCEMGRMRFSPAADIGIGRMLVCERDVCGYQRWVPTLRITPLHSLAPAHTDQTPRQRRGER